jgi:hypothetical protein
MVQTAMVALVLVLLMLLLDPLSKMQVLTVLYCQW